MVDSITSSYGDTIRTFIPFGPHLNNRRSQTLIIGTDPTQGDIMQAVVTDIRNKANLSPPMEALRLIIYEPFWNHNMARMIENVAPLSIFCTEICLVDMQKRWLVRSLVFFRGISLVGTPTHSIISFPLDYLRENGLRNEALFRSVGSMANLRAVMVLPPVDQSLFLTPSHAKLYKDALILILGVLHRVQDVYFPDNIGILSEEDREEISFVLTRTLEDGTLARPAIHYTLRRRL